MFLARVRMAPADLSTAVKARQRAGMRRRSRGLVQLLETLVSKAHAAHGAPAGAIGLAIGPPKQAVILADALSVASVCSPSVRLLLAGKPVECPGNTALRA